MTNGFTCRNNSDTMIIRDKVLEIRNKLELILSLSINIYGLLIRKFSLQ